jgi:cytochrome P450
MDVRPTVLFERADHRSIAARLIPAMNKSARTDLEKIWEIPAVECPAGSIGHSYDPLNHEKMHAALALARKSEPVFYSPELQYWIITRYDDVFQILRDPGRFSAANANTPIVALPDEALAILREGDMRSKAYK